MVSATPDRQQQASFTLQDVYCIKCADAVEQALRAQPHITDVHIDWAATIVHVRYHPSMISADAIEQIIAGTGCTCAPADSSEGKGHDHARLVVPSPARRLTRLAHGVDVQPITMGTKHDRMQYELPAVKPHARHTGTTTASAQPMDHRTHAAADSDAHAAMPSASAGQAIDHAAMGHDMAGIDHAAMGHDMSDPNMAATRSATCAPSSSSRSHSLS
jgi:copper chaperone CopZ